MKMVQGRAQGVIQWVRARFPAGLAMLLLGVVLLVVPSGCHRQAEEAEAPVVRAEPVPASASERKMPSEQPVAAPEDAEPPEEPEQQASEAAPRITFEKVVYDFGEIGTDSANQGQFTFENTGNAPLKIVRVKSCCGVAATGVKAGQVYEPGEKGVLKLDYRAGSYPGAVNRKLYVQSNDPKQDVVTLTIKADIVRRVEYEPKRLRLFLREENAGAGEITLSSIDGRPFSITGFRATANSISAQFDPAVEATRFVLQPQADLEKLQRNLKGQISIDLTHPECKNVRLLYDVLPEFSINPPQILLFNLEEGQPVQREIWILSNYADDFEIESVSSRKGTMELLDSKKVKSAATSSGSSRSDPSARPGARYQLRIEITPPAVEGQRAVLSDVLDVKIKDGDTLSIQCRGVY
jgi:hypothetical protein